MIVSFDLDDTLFVSPDKFKTEKELNFPWNKIYKERLRFGTISLIKQIKEEGIQVAKDSKVGPIAGWPPHTSVENSKDIIKNVLSKDLTFAVTIKGSDEAVGSIGLMVGAESNLSLPETEAEIGYWIGVPFWGNGYIPEAAKTLMRYAFEELRMEKLWCGYFEGNEKSKRAQEKCGFRYVRTDKDVEWKLMNDIRTEHITCMTEKEKKALHQLIKRDSS